MYAYRNVRKEILFFSPNRWELPAAVIRTALFVVIEVVFVVHIVHTVVKYIFID